MRWWLHRCWLSGEAMVGVMPAPKRVMCCTAGASDNVAPHLAAALQASGGGAQAKVQRLGAVGRVRHTGILNGVIPGSSAAAAAVNLYNGSSGAPSWHRQASGLG